MGGSDPKPFDVAELAAAARALDRAAAAGCLRGLPVCTAVQGTGERTLDRSNAVAAVVPDGRQCGMELAGDCPAGHWTGHGLLPPPVELASDVLDVRSTMYRRRVPVAQLRLDQAEVVDLQRDRRYGIRVKTNGYSMPGFYSGHFRLQGGGKGFALVTDRARVLALPVSDGSTLLLSVDRPQALLDALRKVAASAPRQ